MSIKNILNKKDSASGSGVMIFIISLFMIIMMLIAVFFTIDKAALTKIKTGIEEDTVLTNFSISLIDFDKSSKAGAAVLAENDELKNYTGYSNAFSMYDAYIKDSLKLDSNGNPTPGSKYDELLTDFKLEDLRVYLVENKTVKILTYTSSGSYTMEKLPLNNIKSPDGTLIEKTSVYVKESFNLRTTFSKMVRKTNEQTTAISVVLEK